MANAAEIAREREQVLAASQEPMALTDCDRHVTVNRPYADLYGFTGPDEIEGEPWTRCIAEDGRGRFEREIVPDCRADGEWRGTVVGRRRDGTTFPQELSIAWLDDGNFLYRTGDRDRRAVRVRRDGESSPPHRACLRRRRGRVQRRRVRPVSRERVSNDLRNP